MRRVLPLCLLLIATVLAGCEEAVVPTSTGGVQFTLYGALDPTAEAQAIRVIRIRDRLEIPEPGSLGASLTSTDLATGEEQVWRDSVVVLADGTPGNVFVAPFQPEYGHTYRLVAEAEGGLPATVVVEVPPRIEPLLREPTFSLNSISQEVLWLGASRLNAARVRLRLATDDCTTYDMLYSADIAAPIEFGWAVTVPYSRIAASTFETIGVGANTLGILSLSVEADVASAVWVPPGGVYDSEVLVQPGTFSNVTNGFGFVGASYRSSIQWVPSGEAQRRAGFRPLPAGQC